MDKTYNSGLFETTRISVVSAVHRDPKKIIIKKKQPLGCQLSAYLEFIIQNLDVVNLELGMKVQFASF
jgi:hypothetical protein